MSIIGKKMAFIFWLIIILFASTITYFLFKNNFNVETIEIIFPAIGAIVFSLYLGVKYIYIDAPEPQNSRFNVVLVHDTQSGLINPLVMPIAFEPIQHSFDFQGLKKINKYQYELFKGSNVWDPFKSNKVEVVETAISCLIEYTILDWFSEQYAHVGYVDKGTFNSLSGISHRGGAIPQDMIPLSVSKKDAEWNPFLKVRDIVLQLPKGSKVIRKEIDKFVFEITIETPHSIFTIFSHGRSGGQFGGSREPIQKKVRSIFNYPEVTFHLQENNIQIEIEAKQRPFSRFSNQAKIENKWMVRIRELLERDFSWARLSKLYE